MTYKTQADTTNCDLTPDQWRIINYLNFKMNCLADQEDYGLAIDKDAILEHIKTLEAQKHPIISSLTEAMPKVPQYRIKSKPKNTHKKDGTLSKLGEEWYRLLRQNKLPINYDGDLQILTGYEDPNPSSTPQVKQWLYDNGWEPCTFKYVREKDGSERQVEQVRYSSASHPKKGELTESVLRLKERNPAIEYLEKITVINHRLSVFEGFLNSIRTERTYPYVVAGAGGFTNTLRLKHRVPVVNLPKVGKPWGEEIRGAIIAKPGKVFLGSDMVSLESTTKRHYMYPHDPDYVEEMSHPDFDEHLDLAVHAGRTTKEEVLKHVRGEISLKSIRDPFKTVNYSAIYGVGVPKLSREGGFSRSEASTLLSTYWERNWSVKVIAGEQYVKTLKDGTMWLKNPVSGLYHSLRYEKDIFSTLNQSTGVYCFDTWVAYCKAAGVIIPMQYHDEVLAECDEDKIEETKLLMQQAIVKTNEKVKLNVKLGIDIQQGTNYAACH